MMRAGLALLPLLLAGCVAPEEPKPAPRPRPAPVVTVPTPGLEAAPMANRRITAPGSAPILQVDGLSKK